MHPHLPYVSVQAVAAEGGDETVGLRMAVDRLSANNVTRAYAEVMLVATPATRLFDGKKPQRLSGVSQEQIAKMEREMSNQQVQCKPLLDGDSITPLDAIVYCGCHDAEEILLPKGSCPSSTNSLFHHA